MKRVSSKSTTGVRGGGGVVKYKIHTHTFDTYRELQLELIKVT